MALRKLPYMPMYVQDILTDEKLMLCSAETHGVYFRLLLILHKQEQYGKFLLKQNEKQSTKQVENFAYKLAKFLPFPIHIIISSIEELLSEKVLQIEGDFLCQKRMIRDSDISEKRARSGEKGGKTTQKFAKAKHKANVEANTEYEYENDIEDKVEEEKGLKGKNQKSFVAPTLEEFISYFLENGYDEILAARAWRGYDAAGWKDSLGNKIKSWKQKCQHVWFKENNKSISNSAGAESKFEKLKQAHNGVVNPFQE
jgi:uncharacterized protein YdaU (DUF1376 family)